MPRARIAERLQAAYTERGRRRRGFSDRLGTLARRKRAHEWLLPDVQAKSAIEADVSVRMLPTARREWADRRTAAGLSALAIELRTLEAELHDITCRLFELTPGERRVVEDRR